MPQPFKIAVVDEDGDISPIVTVILRGEIHGISPYSLHPYIVPVSVFGPIPRTSSFIDFTYHHGLWVMEAVSDCLIDPRQVDLWIALSPRAATIVRKRVDSMGPAPQDFYRDVFPDPVVECGFTIPTFPTSNWEIDAWYDQLIVLFADWKKRIMKAFYDSS